MTQTQLAKELGLDQAAISHWETGKSYPDNINQNKIADFFGVSIDHLHGRDNGKDKDMIFVNSDIPGIELVRYAISNGLLLEDIKDSVDILIKINRRALGLL